MKYARNREHIRKMPGARNSGGTEANQIASLRLQKALSPLAALNRITT